MSFQQLDNNVKALATAVGQKLAELHVKIGAGSLASEFNDNNVKRYYSCFKSSSN